MDDDQTTLAKVAIITPALAAANNGNWRTADRWANFLGEKYQVKLMTQWQTDDPLPDLMVALHARRSAGSVDRFAQTGNPIVLVLTGTDLYRDIQHDQSAKRSLELADRLVVLQARGPDELSAQARQKCVVIEQSASRQAGSEPREGSFDLLLVGHLRPEKDPLTAARALSRLGDPRIRLRQIGRADDSAVGQQFSALAGKEPRIEMLGNRSHQETRQIISQGRLLVLPSLMEGGANVIIEAILSDTPVLASAIPGSIGMLGENYPGYFPVGNDAALATLIERCQTDAGFMALLRRHCEARAPLFTPEREQRLVRAVVDDILRFR